MSWWLKLVKIHSLKEAVRIGANQPTSGYKEAVHTGANQPTSGYDVSV